MKETPKLKYRLLPPTSEAEGDDPLSRIIEQTGQTIDESMAEKLNRQYENEKLTRGQEAELEVKRTMLENVQTHNPEVKDMTPEKLHAIAMYYELFKVVENLDKTVKKNREIIKSNDAQLEEILTQLPNLREAVEEQLKKTQALLNPIESKPDEQKEE